MPAPVATDPPPVARTRELKIFLVDDDRDDCVIFEQLVGKLRGFKIAFTWTNDFDTAREMLRHRRFDVHFIDYRLGAHSGLELISEALRSDPCKAFVVITGVGDEQLAAQSIQQGAIDYISKDRLSPEQLERCISHCVTEAKQRTEQLRRLAEAHFDGLTGVYRREAFTNIARQLIVASSSTVKNWGLLHIDIDNLSEINREFGFAEGDDTLRAVAKTLRENIGPGDILGRIEDDGFVVLSRVSSKKSAVELAESLRKAIDSGLEVSVSIGVSVEKASLAMLNSLLAGAAMALHEAKEAGRNRVMMSKLS